MTRDEFTKELNKLITQLVASEITAALEGLSRALKARQEPKVTGTRREKGAAYRRRSYEAKKARGECVECTQPATGGRVRCDFHSTKLVETVTRSAAKKKAANSSSLGVS